MTNKVVVFRKPDKTVLIPVHDYKSICVNDIVVSIPRGDRFLEIYNITENNGVMELLYTFDRSGYIKSMYNTLIWNKYIRKYAIPVEYVSYRNPEIRIGKHKVEFSGCSYEFRTIYANYITEKNRLYNLVLDKYALAIADHEKLLFSDSSINDVLDKLRLVKHTFSQIESKSKTDIKYRECKLEIDDAIDAFMNINEISSLRNSFEYLIPTDIDVKKLTSVRIKLDNMYKEKHEVDPRDTK